jgi:hypothetical protein
MMDLDDRLREALRPLRQASVPAAPPIRPAAPEPRATPLGLAAAVAMLVLLAGNLFYGLYRAPGPEARLASRLKTLETRIDTVEHEELRFLLSRELALLRRELELSQENSDSFNAPGRSHD